MKPILVEYRFGCFGNEDYSSIEYRERIQFIVEKFFGTNNYQKEAMYPFNPESLATHKDRINMIIQQNFIEVCFYRKNNDNVEFDRDSLINKSKKFFTDISNLNDKKFTRLAFNASFCYDKLDENQISKICKKMANNFDYLDGEDYINEEWYTRRCDVKVIKLNEIEENINNIVMVNRTRLAQTRKPVIFFSFDINTTHLNMLERFSAAEIDDFIDYAKVIIENIEKNLTDKIGKILDDKQ